MSTLVPPKDIKTTLGLLRSNLAFTSSLGRFFIHFHAVVPLLLKWIYFLIRDLLSLCGLVSDLANLVTQGLLQVSRLQHSFLLNFASVGKFQPWRAPLSLN